MPLQRLHQAVAATVYLLEQYLLLLLHLAKQLADRGILRLHGLDFAFQVLWAGPLALTVVSAVPGFGSVTAAALFGGAAGDCPEADAVKTVTDISANTAEALMNARGIDT